MHDEDRFIWLQHKPTGTLERNGSEQQEGRKEEEQKKRRRRGSARKNPEGRGAKEMGRIKKEKHVQQQSSERTACVRHLDHRRRLTPSPLEEVNGSHSAREHSNTGEGERKERTMEQGRKERGKWREK
ncbi:hypothetical protein EYF80_013406 [Liparis tanakae]|uniref:Uncharacterized protein n=1 Tax=Liparis tanakae TaxID=230148 RepID=A0A4Z2IEQ7_9TELE|nr:hypothetical protein EYF80_013406 [Liparis tanakae]